MYITNFMMVALRYYSSYGYRSSSRYSGGIELLLLFGMLIIPIIAQINVKSTFSKYSKVANSRGLTADQVARKILDANGLYYVNIEHIPGKLSDHFDPKANVVRLSDSVYGKTSVAAIGVAAHECGHACQHAEEYRPIVLRSAVVPAVSFCSKLWYFLFLIGIFISSLSIGTTLIYVSIAMFAAVVLFQLITLPVEFDASGRALKTLEQDSILESAEIPMAGKVLKAAALTYVASLVASLMQLIRLVLIARKR
ncbi:MAG: zinc metallopeptidase [Ruminococcus sp.]|uniref:zinc metallopeptidase n=1 Tax=Ruminococcus sp. TaxID=41978 RepID=UPI0025E718E4|nr:zinc metallopeptidase [Ruminococcus sp.]MCR5601969.1 zinc metallopeptidase [Ruminococcus sp.]